MGEWQYVLGDKLFEPISNKNHNSELPVLAITQDYGAIPREKIDYTVIASKKSIASYKVVEMGDFIISLRSFQGGIEYSKYKGICSPAYIILRKRKELENAFFKYYFKTDLYIRHLNKNLEGIRDGKMVSYKQFSEILLPFPSIPEQQKIASCLSSLDDLITSHTDKLEALKDHKKGLMQNLFPTNSITNEELRITNVPNYRFPDFEKDGEWREKKFEKLLEIGNGRDYKHLSNGDIPVYGSGGFMLSVDDFLYEGESVCIGRKGTIDKPMFLSGKFWTVDTLFYTHSFKGCTPKFIFYIFQNINWLKHNQAGGVPSLSKTNIYKIETSVPQPKEQQKIVDCLSALDALITAQSEKIEQLQQHKKGSMQGLFPKIV